jgi:hypothetical protein
MYATYTEEVLYYIQWVTLIHVRDIHGRDLVLHTVSHFNTCTRLLTSLYRFRLIFINLVVRKTSFGQDFLYVLISGFAFIPWSDYRRWWKHPRSIKHVLTNTKGYNRFFLDIILYKRYALSIPDTIHFM